MKKTRVPKGEKYWFIDQDNGCFYVDYAIEGETLTDERHFQNKNYFTSEKLAESMVEKLDAVLNGADVIEMPSEEEIRERAGEIIGGNINAFNQEYIAALDMADWIKSKSIK